MTGMALQESGRDEAGMQALFSEHAAVLGIAPSAKKHRSGALDMPAPVPSEPLPVASAGLASAVGATASGAAFVVISDCAEA